MMVQNIQKYSFPLKDGAKSYLDMVPEKAIKRITKMAHKAYAEKGNERSLLAFTEDVAKCWLMVREEFFYVVKAHGFEPVNVFDTNTNQAVFLFTENGSFLAGTKLDEDGMREMIYQSVNLIENQMSEKSGLGFLRARRYPDGLAERTKVFTDGSMHAEVDGFIKTTPITSVYVGNANIDKLRMLSHLIQDTILDAGYFTEVV